MDIPRIVGWRRRRRRRRGEYKIYNPAADERPEEDALPDGGARDRAALRRGADAGDEPRRVPAALRVRTLQRGRRPRHQGGRASASSIFYL